MSGLPISASDRLRAETRAARAAGWRWADIWWERLQDRANRDWEEGRRRRALRGFLRAYWLGLVLLPAGDPRRATGLANAGFVARVRGAEPTAARRYAAAARLWAEVPGRIGAVEIRPRARSSLFHLRMELRHGDSYRANLRARLARFVAEAGNAIAALCAGEAPPAALYSRWKGAKPPVFDDTRKLMGACLLIRS